MQSVKLLSVGIVLASLTVLLRPFWLLKFHLSTFMMMSVDHHS